MKTKGTDTLAYKQSVLNGLVNVIELHQRLLNPIEKDKIDALENGLTTRLQALVERSKHEEIDLKIASMREVIAILKCQA
jgi:hypothetical protein